LTNNSQKQVFKGGWEELENAIFTDNQGTTAPSAPTSTFTLKPDGTELYTIEGDEVKTFPLAIPYDPDSIGAVIRSFDLSSDDVAPVGISFQQGEFEGTKMFIGGQDGKVMLAYTLPIPFDTDSIVASPASLSLSAITGTLVDSTFSRDGDFLFAASQNPSIVFSFPLPTPWDITSNVSNTSFDPSLGLNNLFGIDFKPQGDKMYLIDIDKVIEYDLDPINDITTAVANGNELDFSPAAFSDIKFRSNGIEVLFIESIGIVTRFHLDVQWDISTASHFTNSLATVDYQSIIWKPDGKTFFALNSSLADRLDEYTVPNRWNQTGAILVDNFDLTGIANTPRGIWVPPDGLTCMIIDAATDDIVQLDMSVGWDLDTMVDNNIRFDLGTAVGVTNPSGVVFSKDQLTYYVSDSGTDDVFQLTVPTPLDIANSVDTGNSLNLTGMGDLTDIRLKPDDNLMFVSLRAPDRVRSFRLPADGNVSNAVFLQEVNVESVEDNLQGFDIRQNDGKKLWLVGLQSGAIKSMDMSLEFNNALIINFGDELITNAGETLVYA